jgi:hypothetical protein
MSISRRKFNRIALFGSASFASSSGIFFPKPAEAYFIEFPLQALSTGRVFNSFRQYSAAKAIPGVLSSILEGESNYRSQIESGAASVIRSADRVLVNNEFVQNRTELARAGRGVAPSLLWGRQRQENVGPNVGFGFVQKYQDNFTDAKLSGPTITGIYNSQLVLADQRLTPDEIAGSLLPVRSTFDEDEDNLGSWGGEGNPRVSFTQYRTALGEVTFRYELVEPGRGGFGRVQITMESEAQPRRDIVVKINFN